MSIAAQTEAGRGGRRPVYGASTTLATVSDATDTLTSSSSDALTRSLGVTVEATSAPTVQRDATVNIKVAPPPLTPPPYLPPPAANDERAVITSVSIAGGAAIAVAIVVGAIMWRTILNNKKRPRDTAILLGATEPRLASPDSHALTTAGPAVGEARPIAVGRAVNDPFPGPSSGGGAPQEPIAPVKVIAVREDRPPAGGRGLLDHFPEAADSLAC